MDQLKKQASDLLQAVQEATARLKLPELEKQVSDLLVQSQAQGFWNDPTTAQAIMKEQARLEARTKPWRDLEKQLNEAQELLALDDASLQADLEKHLQAAQTTYNELKQQLMYSGPYDDHSAILSIYAGAGGTDAQDWAQMLLRMYVRWAEKHGLKVSTVNESPGEEAGLKSVTLEIDGDFAYGNLKSEHGVHRLVRLSPFNADNLRQTSFAKVEVMPKIDQPDDLALDDKDLKIDVYRSGGHGGQ